MYKRYGWKWCANYTAAYGAINKSLSAKDLWLFSAPIENVEYIYTRHSRKQILVSFIFQQHILYILYDVYSQSTAHPMGCRDWLPRAIDYDKKKNKKGTPDDAAKGMIFWNFNTVPICHVGKAFDDTTYINVRGYLCCIGTYCTQS